MRDIRCDVCGRPSSENELEQRRRRLPPDRPGHGYPDDPAYPVLDVCRDCAKIGTGMWLDHANAVYDAAAAAKRLLDTPAERVIQQKGTA